MVLLAISRLRFSSGQRASAQHRVYPAGFELPNLRRPFSRHRQPMATPRPAKDDRRRDSAGWLDGHMACRLEVARRRIESPVRSKRGQRATFFLYFCIPICALVLWALARELLARTRPAMIELQGDGAL